MIGIRDQDLLCRANVVDHLGIRAVGREIVNDALCGSKWCFTYGAEACIIGMLRKSILGIAVFAFKPMEGRAIGICGGVGVINNLCVV